MSRRDAGTVLPLLVLGFVLGTTVLAAGTAGTAALVARRELAATCDGAALAGATALDRTALDRTALDRTGPEQAGPDPDDPAGRPAARDRYATTLPLDPRTAIAAVEDYVDPGTDVTVGTDGRTVTVRCRRLAKVPFGAVLGRPHGIERTAVSRARSRIRPST